MSNNYFSFKEFTIFQDKSAFKVGTDGVLLGALADIKGVKRILDIGTGTGLISVMLAQRCDAEIVAIEPDFESYNQAKENVTKCKWNSRISVLHTDLQGFFPADGKFDLIVSNPPFFKDSIRNPDSRKAAARHDDSLSSEEILAGFSRLLENDGRCQLILPYVEGSLFIAGAQQYGFFCNDIIKIRPLPTSEIRRLILTFSRQKMKASERFLTIEHGKRHEFTEEYMNITRDFYLKF
jgi:tRNA1Val (adenine37-N6)-methyltransferase